MVSAGKSETRYQPSLSCLSISVKVLLDFILCDQTVPTASIKYLWGLGHHIIPCLRDYKLIQRIGETRNLGFVKGIEALQQHQFLSRKLTFKVHIGRVI